MTGDRIWVVEWTDNNGTVRRTNAFKTQGEALVKAKDIMKYIRGAVFMIRCLAEIGESLYMESTP